MLRYPSEMSWQHIIRNFLAAYDDDDDHDGGGGGGGGGSVLEV